MNVKCMCCWHTLAQRSVPIVMNIANSLRRYYVFCTARFAPFQALGGYVDYKDENASDATDADWSYVSAPDQDNGWRIDDAMFGVKYNANPVFLSLLEPSRIDVSIPDQTKWSPETWSTLGAKESIHTSGVRIRALGIANHLGRALEHWSSSIPNFGEHYRKLPFGSSIIVSTWKPMLLVCKSSSNQMTSYGIAWYLGRR